MADDPEPVNKCEAIDECVVALTRRSAAATFAPHALAFAQAAQHVAAALLSLQKFDQGG